MRRGVLSVLIAVLMAPGSAGAATIAVTTTNTGLVDDGQCGVREAITAAQADTAFFGCSGGGGSFNEISLPTGTYQLAGAADDNANASGDLDVIGADALSIRGAGRDATIFDGGGVDRVLQGHGAAVGLLDLTVRGGRVPAVSGVDGRDGGGVVSTGALSLSRVLVADNHAGDTDAGHIGGYGGGVAASGGLVLAMSEIRDNRAGAPAGRGGGVSLQGGDANMYENLFRGNRAGEQAGGAPGPGGGFAVVAGQANLRNSTLTDNHGGDADAPSGIPGGGGGIHVSSPSTNATYFTNVTVVGNTAGAGNPAPTSHQLGVVPGAMVVVEGSAIGSSGPACVVPPTVPFRVSFATDGSCGSATVAADLGLRPLGDFGGPTRTMLPRPTSVLVDAAPQGNGYLCVPDDQRKLSRVGTCDAGAAEFRPAADVTAVLPPFAATTAGTATAPLPVTIDAPGDGAEVLSVAVVGSAFALASDGCSGAGIGLGATCQVAITFAPPAPGPHAAELRVTTAGGGTDAFPLTGTGVAPPAPGPGPTGTTPAAPQLTALSLTRRSFRAARRGASVTAPRRTPATGTRVRFTLDRPASVRFTLQRKVRRRGRTTLRPVASSITRAGKAGANSFFFTGRLAGKRLAAAGYRLTATPAGGAARTVDFTITR